MNNCFVPAAVACVCASAAFAGPISIDFSTDDFGTPLVNGQSISSPDEFGNFFTVSASGSNLGAAIFDSTVGGPNAGGGDPDLLVDLGNILILQRTTSPTQTVPGIFDTPNDSAAGGTFSFEFLSAVELFSITLVDVNGGNDMSLVLTDGTGLTRTYTVPEQWTFDPTDSPNGFMALDLTTLIDQPGEAISIATAVEDFGFNAADVIRFDVSLTGSGGIDNLTFIPTPGTVALAGLAGLAGLRRKR